jgi:hypothetical protein
MSSVPAQGFNVATPITPNTVIASGIGQTIANNQGLNLGAVVQVTNVLGTNPTLNVVLQTSQDGGATWQDVFHFEQLTADGSAVMPPNKIFGLHRYVWNVGGTLPSFTFSILETGCAQDVGLSRRIFDYTAALLAGTLNAVSAPLTVAGAHALAAFVTLAAGGTPGSYVLEVSPDGVNWVPVGGPTAAVAGATISLEGTFVPAQYARVRCSAAGTGQTGSVVALTAV